MKSQRAATALAIGLLVASGETESPESIINEYLDLPATPHEYRSGESDAQVTLGRVLFYDTRLSATNSVSCASCHKQQHAFADNVAFSEGFDGQPTRRNTLPLIGVRRFANFKPEGALFPRAGGMFWDGRKTSLHEAAVEPIFDHIEMGISDMQALTRKLEQAPYYKPLFKAAYDQEQVTSWGITNSLVAFIVSMRSESSRFRQSELGMATLNESELLGQKLFIEKYNCSNCHKGQLGKMTPREYEFEADFANIGLPGNSEDQGLKNTTTLSIDQGRFRVPSLDNVGLTAPYMHDGSIATLEEVIDHYSHSIVNDPNLDMRLREPNGAAIRMDISEEEKKAIIDFLLTFTDTQIINDQWFSDPFKPGRN
jgi:cytochrome c peroxidase